MRDLYGELIDGMQGARGQIRSGGDMGAVELSGSPPTQAPLALYSGIVTVGADGTANVSFDIPAFAGTVRVMAVAWSNDKVGKASGDVIVRDPVVMTATLPRFLRTGDRGAVQVELDNVEGAAGAYKIAIDTAGSIKREGAEPAPLTLAAKARGRLSVPISASGSGASTVVINVEGPSGFKLARSFPLDVRPATQILTRRSVRQLAKGETLTLSNDVFADFVPGTGRAGLSVAISTSLDAATLLNALDRYPFGCSEQITSRAMAMLYINDLAAQARLAPDGEIDVRIKDAIARLAARQGANGSFGLWSVGGEDPWLDAYVTDFLTRAREKKFDVPQTAMTLALDRLRNYVATAPEPNKNGGRELAYAFYVLARNGAAPVGDLRYIADVKLNDLATPIAKAQVAAALAMLGDKTRADRVYRAALDALPTQPKLEIGREDYGSALRDAAALVTLASEGHAPQATITQAVARVDSARGLATYTSTQEDAWLVMAAKALASETNAIRLDVNGDKRQGAYYRSFKPEQLASPVRVSNSGDGTVQAVVSVSRRAADAGAGGIEWLQDRAQLFHARRRAGRSGQGQAERPFRRRAQDDRAAAAVRPRHRRRLFAGRASRSTIRGWCRRASTGTLAWITDAATPENSEFRDDRFTAAFDRRARLAAGVQRRLCGSRCVARTLRPAAGQGRRHVSARPLRPHRDRRDRCDGREMTAPTQPASPASR